MGDRTEADHILATALIADAIDHEAGRHLSIAERYDEVEAELLPIQDLKERRFAIAFNFWDGWTDASNHNWYNYPGIAERNALSTSTHHASSLLGWDRMRRTGAFPESQRSRSRWSQM